jgi:hypothetical protein
MSGTTQFQPQDQLPPAQQFQPQQTVEQMPPTLPQQEQPPPTTEQLQPLQPQEQPLAPQSQAVPAAARTAPASDAAPAASARQMGAIGYLLMMIVFSLPIIGLVMAFVWALGPNWSRARRRFALAQLILWGLFIAGCIAFYIFNIGLIIEQINVIIELIKVIRA